jgi:WD repeat-containing protein 24
MGQRGQLDRIPLAHNGPILALDWTLPTTSTTNSSHRTGGPSGSTQSSNWYAGVGSGLFDDLSGSTMPTGDGDTNGNGWLASGGLDRTVKVCSVHALASNITEA